VHGRAVQCFGIASVVNDLSPKGVLQLNRWQIIFHVVLVHTISQRSVLGDIFTTSHTDIFRFFQGLPDGFSLCPVKNAGFVNGVCNIAIIGRAVLAPNAQMVFQPGPTREAYNTLKRPLSWTKDVGLLGREGEDGNHSMRRGGEKVHGGEGKDREGKGDKG